MTFGKKSKVAAGPGALVWSAGPQLSASVSALALEDGRSSGLRVAGASFKNPPAGAVDGRERADVGRTAPCLPAEAKEPISGIRLTFRTSATTSIQQSVSFAFHPGRNRLTDGRVDEASPPQRRPRETAPRSLLGFPFPPGVLLPGLLEPGPVNGYAPASGAFRKVLTRTPPSAFRPPARRLSACRRWSPVRRADAIARVNLQYADSIIIKKIGWIPEERGLNRK